MMEQLKIEFKLLKYAHHLKLNIFAAVVSSICAMYAMLFDEEVRILGSILIVAAAMMPGQLFMTTRASGMMVTAPKRKAAEIDALCLLNGIFMIPASILGTVSLIVLGCNSLEETKACILTQGGIILAIFVYLALCSKYYVASLIFLFFVVMPITAVFEYLKEETVLLASVSIEAVCLIAFVCLLVGFALHFFVARLLYKKEYASIVFGNALKLKNK